MIMTKDVETKAKGVLESLPGPIKAIIQNSSVKLSGGTPKGSTFTRSGVILCQRDSETWVLTAKHNLFIFNDKKDPPPWDDDLLTPFRASAKIYYDEKMAFGKEPTREAAITSIEPVFQNGTMDWSYDVMIVKSKDAGLCQFAKSNAVYREALATNQKDYLKKSRWYQSTSSRTFIVTGFGEPSDKSDNGGTPLPRGEAGGTKKGALQYRIALPRAAKTTSVFLQHHDKKKYTEFRAAIQLDANERDSTAPGDSGGPLFVVFYDKTAAIHRLHLIGVTTGSDMAASAIPCPSPAKLRDNNVSTSLELFYQSGIFTFV